MALHLKEGAAFRLGFLKFLVFARMTDGGAVGLTLEVTAGPDYVARGRGCAVAWPNRLVLLFKTPCRGSSAWRGHRALARPNQGIQLWAYEDKHFV